MTWTLSGTLLDSGLPGVLSWSDGALVGSREALLAVDAYIAGNRMVPRAHMGPYVESNKTDPVSAFALACTVMPVGDVTGDPPWPPALPDGAIA